MAKATQPSGGFMGYEIFVKYFFQVSFYFFTPKEIFMLHKSALVKAVAVVSLAPLSAYANFLDPITTPIQPSIPYNVYFSNPGSTVESFSLQYQNPNDSMVLKPEQTHLCVLSQLGGSGGGALVYVDGNGQWVLQKLAPRAQDDVVGAKCFPKSVFRYPQGGIYTKRWNSGVFETKRIQGFDPCTIQAESTWHSDAATMLQGLYGPRNVSTHRVSVVQFGDSPNVSSRVLAEGCGAHGYASSFFVGVPGSGQIAKFHGPLGRGTIQQAGTYHLDSETGYRSNSFAPVALTLAPIDSTVCYFTYLSGNFGADNNVAIIKGDTHWFVRAFVGYGAPYTGHIKASVNCFLSTQY
jgi:hypothetical protein